MKWMFNSSNSPFSIIYCAMISIGGQIIHSVSRVLVHREPEDETVGEWVVWVGVEELDFGLGEGAVVDANMKHKSIKFVCFLRYFQINIIDTIVIFW